MKSRSTLALKAAAMLLTAAGWSCAPSLPKPAEEASRPDLALGEGAYVRRLPRDAALKTTIVTLVSVEQGDYCHVVAKPVDGSPELSLVVAHDDLGLCHDEGAGPGAKRWGGDRRLRATYRSEFYCQHEPPCAEDGPALEEGLVLLELSRAP